MKEKYGNYHIVAKYNSKSKKPSVKERGLLRKLLPQKFKRICWEKALVSARKNPDSKVIVYYDRDERQINIEIDSDEPYPAPAY